MRLCIELTAKIIYNDPQMKRKIALFLLGTALTVLALLVLIHTPPIRSLALTRIRATLEDATGARVSIQSLQYNLLNWTFTLKGVVLSKRVDAATPKDVPPFLSIDEINIDLPYPFGSDLLNKIQDIRIHHPVFHYRATSKGDNLPIAEGSDQADTSSGKLSLPSFLIKRFNINRANIRLEFPETATRIEIPGLNLDLRGLPDGRHRIRIHPVTGISLTVNNTAAQLDLDQIEGYLDHRSLQVDKIQLTSKTGQLSVTGSIDIRNLNDPILDLGLEAKLIPEQSPLPLPQVFPGTTPYNGDLSVSAQIKGAITNPLINGIAQFNDFRIVTPVSTVVSGSLQIKTTGLDAGNLNAFADILMTPTGLKSPSNTPPLDGRLLARYNSNKKEVELISVKLPGFRLEGKAELSGPSIQGNLNVEAENIRSTLNTLTGLPLPQTIANSIKSAGDQISEGNIFIKTNIQGSLEHPVLKVETRGRFLPVGPAAVQPLDFTGHLNWENGSTHINRLHVQRGKGQLILSGTFPPGETKKPIKLSFTAKNISQETFIPLVNLPFNGNIDASAAILLPPGSERLEVAMETLRMNIQGPELHELSAAAPFDFAISSNNISIRNLNLTGKGTSITASGSLPEGIKINAQLDGALAAGFLPSLSAKGRISLDGQLSGNLSALVVSASVNLDQGSFGLKELNGSIDDIEGELDFALEGSRQQLTVKHLDFNWNGAKFNLSGPVVPSPDLHLKVQNLSQRIFVPYLPDTLKDMLTVAANLDCHVKGTNLSLQETNGTGTLSGLSIGVDNFYFKQGSGTEIKLKDNRIYIDNIVLDGPESHISGSGFIECVPPFSFQARLEGLLQAPILGAFWEGPRFTGTGRFQLEWTGGAEPPLLNGELAVSGGGFSWQDMNLYMDGLNTKLQWKNGQLSVPQRITANLNGGDLHIQATPRWTFHLDNVRWDYPAGLRGQVSGKLMLIPRPPRTVIQGELAFSNGTYKEPFDLSSQLFSMFRRNSADMVETFSSSGPEDLEFDIHLRTATPVRLENNVGKAELTAQLKLSGPPSRPVLAGRASFKEGGEFYLGKHTFYIDRGFIDFTNPYHIEPELDINTRSKVDDTDIRLRLEGNPQALSASLTSTPAMPEQRIIQLLVTGKNSYSSSGGVPTPLWNEAGSRALDYLGMTLAGKLERAVKRKLGLDTVRLDGSLVASRENPGARLTIGTHLTDNLEAIVSQSLKRSQDRTWIVEYNPANNIRLEAARTDDNAYSATIRHKLRWGLKEPPGKKVSVSNSERIKEIIISGNTLFPQPLIRKKLRLKRGTLYRFYTVQKAINRLQKMYHKHRYLDVSIATHKEGGGKETVLVIEIDAGEPVRYQISGLTLTSGLKKRLDNAWLKGYTPAGKTNNLVQELYRYLFKKGYYKAVISPEKPAVIHVKKGLAMRGIRFTFSGVENVSSSTLQALMKTPAMKTLCLTNAEAAARRIEQWFKQRGFLAVRVKPPVLSPSNNQRIAEVHTQIDEGVQFRFGAVQFKGTRYTDESQLRAALPIRTGTPFSPILLDKAVSALETLFTKEGNHYSRVYVQSQIVRERNQVDIDFHLDQRPRYRINDIRIMGITHTRPSALRRRFMFKKGQIVHLKEINGTRKRLYDMNVFESVNISIQPGEQPVDQKGEAPCTVVVEVKEQKPLSLHYGLQWDTRTYAGVTAQFGHLNFGGGGNYLGASMLMNAKEQDGSLFFKIPYWLGANSGTEFYLFANRKELNDVTEPVKRWGITVQQQWQPVRTIIASLGYTYETYEGDESLVLSHLTAAATFDTRDSLLDASQGVFISQSLQYSAKWLGSGIDYFRYLGVFNLYLPIFPRLVSATSLHLGLGDALGKRVLPGGERFYLGGATTLRGFNYNHVGPIDPAAGEPSGGSAMLLFRQELRWKLFPSLGAVVFADMGNIYPDIPSFRPFALRTAAGIGLRLQLSGLLLRLDWGFKLKRLAGESPSQIYFSIGQAF